MSTFTNQTKNSVTAVNETKNSVTLTNSLKTRYNQHLLMEDGGFLLQEDGGKIILEQSVLQIPSWGTLIKS